jgi:chromosome segregation ATPase
MARGDSFLGDKSAADVFESKDELNALLDEVKKAQEEAGSDISTEDARKALVSLAAKVTRTKTALDEAGKASTETARKLVETVNARRRVVRERLEHAAEAIRAPVTKFELDEQERQTRFQKLLDQVVGARTVLIGTSADEVERRINELRDLPTPNDVTEEEREKLTDERITTLSMLETMLPSMRAEEDKAARLATMEAERDRMATELRQIERQQQETERQLAAARGQVDAAKQQVQEAEVASARFADQDRRMQVRREIIDALGQEARINTQLAERVATALIAGVIPHVRVEF